MRTIQLYASGAATATDAAHVTIPTSGKIKGVSYSVLFDQEADADTCRLELSKVPTNQIGTNGAIDPFFEVGSFNSLVTSGMHASGLHGFQPLNIDVRAGEIVYCHATVTATTYYANFILHYE